MENVVNIQKTRRNWRRILYVLTVFMFVAVASPWPPTASMQSRMPDSASVDNIAGENTKRSVSSSDVNRFDGEHIVRVLMPGIGNYPGATVALGSETTVTPDAVPISTTSINVSTDSNFKGTFVGNTTTGVVRITNAHPAGSYLVTLKASDGFSIVSKTFTLTVTNGTVCAGTVQSTSAADVSVGTTPFGVAIGDFNNDGNQDVATANLSADTVSVRLGNGSGGFTGTTDVAVGSTPYGVAIGDFNGDGNQDLASANSSSGTVSIRLGNGSGGFSGSTDVNVGSNPQYVAVGDFNADGNQDFASANFGSSSVSIRLGNGLGGFSGTTNVTVSSFSRSVVIGDFNNDGKQDFAASSDSSNSISIRMGDGAGGFNGTTNISIPGGPLNVAIGDFNNDGNKDIATANITANTVSVRLGDGLGGFGGGTDTSVGTAPRLVAIGDFNNDGKQDVATVNQNAASVSIRLGDGLGTFTGTMNVSVGAGPAGLAIGDFNHDAKQDFVTANTSSNTASVRLNTCSMTTAAGVALSGRVLSSGAGRGIRNARVNITDEDGSTRSATTGAFGAYHFDDVESGHTYIISVMARRFQFSPRILQVFDDLHDIDIVSLTDY